MLPESTYLITKDNAFWGPNGWVKKAGEVLFYDDLVEAREQLMSLPGASIVEYLKEKKEVK